MKEEFEKLLQVSPPTEQTKLKILYNAQATNANAYLGDSSAANLKSWQAAEEALNNLMAELHQKYSEPSIGLAFESTAKPIEVYRWLKDNGWKIGQARFYEHVKEGKLGRDDAGQFTARLVSKYAKTFLKRSDTGKTVKDDDADLQRQKLVEEIRVKRIEGERNQLKLDAERGLYLRRDTVEMELAGRAAALEAGFDHLIYTRAAEWIAIVKGDQARTDQMIAALMSAKDEWLNTYASAQDFVVTIMPDKSHMPNQSHEAGGPA